MIDVSELIDNIRMAFSGRNRAAVISATVLIVMTMAAVIVVSITFTAPKKPSEPPFTEQEFTPDHPVLVPPSPVASDGYVYSRDKHGRWTEEDAAPWFTPPDATALSDLSQANDRIITDILDAAP
ncbi:MAG: hypothetical protein IJ191_02850 [Treponema sp.]|nr:hypothetical protein [Treponema sp.]